MKDGQTDLSGQQAYIPIVSPVLHVLAMPALVFLRSSFGFLYLRPKSIFLSLSLASTLLFIVGLNESSLWEHFRGAIIFAFLTACLYVAHLVVACVAQVREQAGPDTYSGKSHLLWISSQNVEVIEIHLHLWLEPLLVALAGACASLYGAPFFANWLFLTALALALKELRTYWSEIRKRKRKSDLRTETEEEAHFQRDDPIPAEPSGTRKPRRTHRRDPPSARRWQ